MFNFAAIFTPTGMASLGQIIIGDLTMAGDNVVIMGSLASGLPAKDRSGRLDVTEPPDLGALLRKINQSSKG